MWVSEWVILEFHDSWAKWEKKQSVNWVKEKEEGEEVRVVSSFTRIPCHCCLRLQQVRGESCILLLNKVWQSHLFISSFSLFRTADEQKKRDVCVACDDAPWTLFRFVSFLMEYQGANKASESNSSFTGLSISECRLVTTGTLVSCKCSERETNSHTLTGCLWVNTSCNSCNQSVKRDQWTVERSPLS